MLTLTTMIVSLMMLVMTGVSAEFPTDAKLFFDDHDDGGNGRS